MNEIQPDEDQPRISSTIILIAIGVLLLIAAVLLYPEARQHLEEQRVQETLGAIPTHTPPLPTPTEATPSLPEGDEIDPPIFTHPSQFGTLVLSIREGKEIHLFAYQPFLEEWSGVGFSGLPLTRLTSGPQQDITPDISPDGRFIAFSSNRGGAWDIYILDLLTGDIRQFTDTAAYDANPSWSPDGQWLAYESYQVDNLEILIQDRDQTAGSIPLTRIPSADFSPDWSEQGRWISFISSRSGQLEVWYADLDSPAEDKAVRVPNLSGVNVKHPGWSTDGRYLTWSVTTQNGNHNLLTWDSEQPQLAPVYSGPGDWPLWAGDILYAVIEQPDASYLTAYPAGYGNPEVMLPTIKLPGRVEGISWANETNFAWLSELSETDDFTSLWKQIDIQEETGSDDKETPVQLRDLSAPYPALHPDAAGSFTDLRSEVTAETGWDFLSTLENAYVPLDQPLPPGVSLPWLHTARGMMVNDIPRLADWLVVVQEQYGSQTYWRVFLRANNQQGLQGRPLQSFPWDLSARYSGNNADYENGGARSENIPQGYWVDFTVLAEIYGWQRFPAETYWQFSEKASRYQYFAFTQGLALEQALLQLYSADEIQDLSRP